MGCIIIRNCQPLRGKKHGREAPAEINETPSLWVIPVIVMTTWESEEDIPATC